MNEVAVARHGPILNDNEAMGKKVFRYLPGLGDNKNGKWSPKSNNPKITQKILCLTV